MADIFNLTDTWNNAGLTFSAIKMNVTDTASNAASKLIDLQVAGVSKFSVNKSGAVLVPDGTEPLPSIAVGTANVGLYSAGGQLAFVIGGALQAYFATNGKLILNNQGVVSPNVYVGTNFDIGLVRDGTGVLGMRNPASPTSAMAFNVYNTYTDGSNYERGFIRYSSNVLQIGHEAAGTGNTGRDILFTIGGNLRLQLTNSLATFGINVTAQGSIKSTHATNGVGYDTTAGGAVTQGTSRTTGVTLNKVCGAITLVSAAGSTAIQSFTVTNSAVVATDTIIINQKSGTDKYRIYITAVGAGSFEVSFATLSGTTTEQPVFNFAVLKAVAA